MRYIVLFWCSLLGYAIWSYGLADPNLVLTSWEPYWVFQNWIWSIARTQVQFFTGAYLVLLLLLFWFSIRATTWLRSIPTASTKKVLLGFFLAVSPLLISYNALSHDVFNYLFNAKMVVVYRQDPHIHTALEFSDDDWTRFMHNTHTPAPYGYGWTGLSVLPYMLGMGKFTLSWIIFRLFSAGSLVLVFLALRQLAERFGKKLSLADAAVFFLNPLVLIEVLSNSHNDLWMLAPALFGFSVLFARKRWSLRWRVVASLILLGFSISIKYATAVLLPIWFVVLSLERFEANSFAQVGAKTLIPKNIFAFFTQGLWQRVLRIFPYVAAVFLFIPLVTTQSQQYLPWYLTWSLVWMPFISSKKWRRFWLVLSIAALLRYVPWLYAGGYQVDTVQWQKMISWGIPVVWLAWFSMRTRGKTSVPAGDILIGKTIHE